MADMTTIRTRRTWRTRLGCALFVIALVVLLGAAIIGVVLIRAFQHTLPPTNLDDRTPDARLNRPVTPPATPADGVCVSAHPARRHSTWRPG
jgi:hypothetical protein